MLSHYTACPSRCIEPLHPHNLLKAHPSSRLAQSPLPPLSKVRCCRPKEFGRLPEGLPHHYPLAPHQPFQKPHYPSKIANTLASLVKGRWIDGKAQTVALLHFACDTSTFLIYQTFRRQDGGIATPLLPKPHYPLLCTTFLPYERSVGFASMPRQPLVSLRPAATKCG